MFIDVEGEFSLICTRTRRGYGVKSQAPKRSKRYFTNQCRIGVLYDSYIDSHLFLSFWASLLLESTFARQDGESLLRYPLIPFLRATSCSPWTADCGVVNPTFCQKGMSKVYSLQQQD